MFKSADNVDEGEIKNPPYPYIQENAMDYLARMYPKVRYKKIIAFFFLEHLKPVDLSFIPYLINQALTMGGEFMAVVPDFDSICKLYLEGKLSLRMAEIDVLSQNNMGPHSTLWNKQKVEELFLEDGFELIEYRTGVAGRGIGGLIRVQKIAEDGTPPELYRSVEELP